MRSSNRSILAAVVVIALVACAFALHTRNTTPTGPALPPAQPRAGATPIMWPAPQFSFPDQDDSPISTQSLAGKVWIADFIFTHCANTCPKMTAKRAELIKQIPDPRVMFISFSVDPTGDDRPTRKAYAGTNRLDESRWKFLCPPDRQTVLKVAQAMKIAAAEGHGQSPILHSDRFVLIDSHGRIRGNYPMEDEPSMQRLVNDALALAKDGD